MLALVTHCLSDPFTHYAAGLYIQLGSLFSSCPACYTTAHVCYDEDDELTSNVVSYWSKRAWQEHCWFRVMGWVLSRNKLCRRSIGRNAVMQHIAGKAEMVWMCDADFVFGNGCLDTLVQLHRNNKLHHLATPDSFYVHKTHELGDKLLASVQFDYEPPSLDQNDFMLSRAEVPIGGLQIVSGELIAEGYLPDGNWQKPVDGSKGFASFIDDRKFRQYHEKKGRRWDRIALPNLYRIRHSKSSMNPTGDSKKFRTPNG